MILKAITFNMCHGEGIDRKIDVERQAKFLRKYKPDIIFLQEIDMYTQRVYSENQIYTFSKYVELPYRTMGINIKYKNGYYGDGILSRFPIEYSTNYLMPLVDKNNEQRGILCNKISFGTTKLNLFSVHYPTNFEERKLGTEELVNIIEKIDESEIIIVGGDFNIGVEKIGKHKYKYEKSDKYVEYEMLKEILNKVNNTEDTWFSSTGQGCIDTMFYSKNIKLLKQETIKTKYSDHSAVYAEFEV
ncbi:MAG: endonuclease/exonuclease/phosphatase family protein [Clostridia bacterium]|nr:endonuclease/exonuclease/phosphatase family protein [Clostridia bacterium]